jgi:hypothetical protein
MKVSGAAHQRDKCEEIEGISVNMTETAITGVTSIENEAMICGEVNSNLNSQTIHSGDGVHDIAKYLSRPWNRDRGTISSGTGLLTSLSFNTISGVKDHVGAVAWGRLAGAAGLRGTLVFRMVVTATPFHQGVLALSFQYGNSNLGPDARRGFFFPLSVNLPHVKLDLAENTSAELRVPFVSSQEYWSINEHPVPTTSSVGYGFFTVNKLTDVRVIAGQTAPSYTIYTSIEDVEIIGTVPTSLAVVNLQAGTTSEREARSAGIVSGILDAGASLAKSVGRIPNLRKLGSSTSWFLASAANVAAAFGYSKPTDTSAFTRIVHRDYNGESHIDLPSTALVAGPFQSNSLVVDGTVGADSEDHMSLDYILSKPSYIYRKVWSGSAVTGDLLYGCRVSPSCFWYREGGLGNIPLPANATLTTSAFLPSTLMYVGSNFRYWRGDLRFTFHFSKTKLHGGRIMISYLPARVYGNATPSGTTAVVTDASGGPDMNTYCKLFDLKDGSVVTFDVPYATCDPYTAMGSVAGYLAVQVVSPLNTPGNASASIDMMVFVEALPGFEFAGVCPSTLEAHNPRSDHTTFTGIYLQAGGVNHTADASQRVVGEIFRSVKQLAMIPDWNTFDINNASSFDFTLFPWFKKDYINSVSGNAAIPDTASALFYASKCGRMGEMYSFVNGSTDWTVISDRPDAGGLGLTVYTVPNDANTLATPASNIYNKAALRECGFNIVESRGSMRVRVPAYTKYARIPFSFFQFKSGSNQTTMSNLIFDPEFIEQMTAIRVRNTSGSTVRFTFGRAAGDDATMAQFVGPPVCCFFQSTKTTSPNSSAANF